MSRAVQQSHDCSESCACASCRRRAVCAKYYQRHTDLVKARCAAYRASDGVKRDRAEKARAYRLLNRPRIRVKLQEWRAANPEASRLANIEAAHIRRCRLAGVAIERFSRGSIFIRDRAECNYCGLGLDPGRWHLDHVKPISKGGGHTRANVVASCPTCNMKKGNREGDFDMASALHRAGHEVARLPLVFLVGGVRRGQPEVAA